MKTHALKCWPEYFQAVVDGTKTFELRKDDRCFEVGDLLHLFEWNPGLAEYAGRELLGYTNRQYLARVTYILRDFPGLRDGWVVMGIVNAQSEETTWNASAD